MKIISNNVLGAVTGEEIELLREMGKQVAEISQTPRNQKARKLWIKVNDLEMKRPVVLAYALPWNELNVNDELTCQCENEYLKEIETEFRQTLYLNKHMPLDMVVEPYIKSKVFYEDSGFGIKTIEDTIKEDTINRVAYHSYKKQIATMEDVEKIKDPVITYDEERTKEALGINHFIFDGILEVKLYCYLGKQYAPWDFLAELIGVEEFFRNLYEQPELMLATARRYSDASVKRLKQFETLGILTQNIDNVVAGSGGYCYTSEIKQVENVTVKDTWGNSAAQIFTGISPEMFDKFAISQEFDWLSQFAMTYYGCCEALDDKIHTLRKVKNLRKISISSWADSANAAEKIGKDYVYSFKPNPSHLAFDTLDEKLVKNHIKTAVDPVLKNGCNMEIILKTLTTVKYNPQKLWRWGEIAMDIIEHI